MIDRPTDSDLRSADIFALGLVALQLCCPQASLPSTGIEWNRLRRGDLSYYDLSSAPAELVPLIQRASSYFVYFSRLTVLCVFSFDFAEMLSPDPRDRPTITHLLNHPRMQTIVQRRKNEPNLPALNWDAQKMRSHYEGLVHNSRVSQLAHSSCA